jgi:hypothetical protein
VRSDTGELYRSWKKRYGWINTPRTKAAYGFIGAAGKVDLDGVSIDAQTDFATVAVSSLTDKPISESDNLLLTTVGRADNAEVKYNKEHTVQMDCGHGPIMVETIKARLEIRTSVPGMEVKAINPEGFIIRPVPSEQKDGVLSFEVGDEMPSMYYLIQAQ